MNNKNKNKNNNKKKYIQKAGFGPLTTQSIRTLGRLPRKTLSTPMRRVASSVVKSLTTRNEPRTFPNTIKNKIFPNKQHGLLNHLKKSKKSNSENTLSNKLVLSKNPIQHFNMGNGLSTINKDVMIISQEIIKELQSKKNEISETLKTLISGLKVDVDVSRILLYFELISDLHMFRPPSILRYFIRYNLKKLEKKYVNEEYNILIQNILKYSISIDIFFKNLGILEWDGEKRGIFDFLKGPGMLTKIDDTFDNAILEALIIFISILIIKTIMEKLIKDVTGNTYDDYYSQLKQIISSKEKLTSRNNNGVNNYSEIQNIIDFETVFKDILTNKEFIGDFNHLLDQLIEEHSTDNQEQVKQVLSDILENLGKDYEISQYGSGRINKNKKKSKNKKKLKK